MEWSNDLAIQLIEAYRDRPLLWDVDHKYNKFAKRKNAAWAELAQIFNTDVIVVKNKMNSLLASFRRERNRKTLARKTGFAHKDYHSTWFAFSSFKFLTDLYAKRNPKQAIEDDDIEELGTVVNEDSFADNVLKMDIKEEGQNNAAEKVGVEKPSVVRKFVLPKKKLFLKRKLSPEGESNTSEAYILKAVSPEKTMRDDCAVYGEHVGNKLRGFDKRTRAIAQHCINNILFDAEMGKFSDPESDFLPIQSVSTYYNTSSSS